MNKKKINKKAFTLIEILVAMAIMSIIALGAGQINFKRLSQKQEVSILANSIVSNVEMIRDYAYTGKGVGTSLNAPVSWEMRFSQAGNGAIATYYNTGSLVSFPETNWNSDGAQEILAIECEKNDGTTLALSGTGIIRFQGKNMSLSGCDIADEYYKKLTITFAVSELTETVEINTVNGVVQKR